MAVDPTYFKLPTESVDDYNKRIAAAHPDLPAPGATSVTGVTNTAVAPNQNGSLQGTLTTPPPATTPAPTGTAVATPMTQGGFSGILSQVENNLKTNNNIASQRQLLLKHLFDSPLTPAEVAQLPPDQQHLVGTGDKDAIELQVRILNDQLQGRANTLDQSVKYLTDAYGQDVKDAEDKKQQAIDNVQKFAATYGSNAGAALKSLYGDQYIQQLKDMGIDINAFSQLSPQTVSEEKANPSDSSSVTVTIPSGTIASQTNNPLNIKFIAGNELNGKDSGIAAQDGGTFAAFDSPEDGLNAAMKLLQSPTYSGLTVDQAMKKWSNNGYGANVSPTLNAKQTVGSLSDDQLTQLVDDMAKRESGATIEAVPSDVDITAQSLVDGTQAPSLISAYGGARNKAIAAAKRLDPTFDANKAELDFQAAKKLTSALNSTQMVKYQGLAGSVVNTIDETRRLAQQIQNSGIPALNAAKLATLAQTQGNTPNGQLAVQYLTSVNTLKEEFANLASGGYAPTDSSWNLANTQINGNYGVDQLDASLSEIQRLINYRLQAIGSVQPVTAGSGTFGQSSPSDGTNDAPSQFDSLFNQYGGK